MSEGVKGTIYLACIDEPVGSGARHYLGWSRDVLKREDAHRNGKGSKLLKAAKRAGVGWEIVRTWEGKTRADEAAMKRRGHLAQYCPRCREAWLKRRNEMQNARRARDGRADRPRSNPRGPKR